MKKFVRKPIDKQQGFLGAFMSHHPDPSEEKSIIVPYRYGTMVYHYKKPNEPECLAFRVFMIANGNIPDGWTLPNGVNRVPYRMPF